MHGYKFIVGVNLSKLDIDRDNIQHMYITFSPTFVTPYFPRSVYAPKYSMYSGISMCSLVWLLKKTRTKVLVVCCEDYQWRQVEWWTHMAHGINELRQLSCSGPVTCHCTCVKRLMGWLYCCFVMFITTYWVRHCCNYCAFMLVVWCWAVNANTSQPLLAPHSINNDSYCHSSGSPPVFLESTSDNQIHISS